MHGTPPHEVDGSLQDLFCSLKATPQLEEQSEISFHLLQPPLTEQPYKVIKYYAKYYRTYIHIYIYGYIEWSCQNDSYCFLKT